MADLTSLTETTTPAATDLLYVVKDPAGTPLPRKSTIGSVLAQSGLIELDYGETSVEQTTNNATIVDITACTVDFTIATGGRPVHVIGHIGGASHTVVDQAVQAYIRTSGNVIQNDSRGYYYASVANSVGQIFCHSHITAPGVYSFKLSFVGTSATANSAKICVAGLSSCFLVALQT